MYKTKESGLTVYETLDELLNSDIEFVSDYNGKYYIGVKPESKYDNSIWKVDKRTGEVSCSSFIDYMLEIEDKATPVDPKTLRKGA